MLMPFAMLYPPNVAALPPVTHPYPHFCNSPRPRFADTPSPRGDTFSRARATTATSTISASSTAAPSTPRSMSWIKRPKTPHPTREKEKKEKKERTPFSAYAIAALAGCAQYSAPYSAPTTGYGFFTPVSTNSNSGTSGAAGRRGESATTTPTTNTRFTEQFVRTPEKVKGTKREKIRKCGRKLGNWIANLCWQDGDKQRQDCQVQPVTCEVDEKHEPQTSTECATTSGTDARRISAASEVTLVDSGEEVIARTRTRTQNQTQTRTTVSPGTVYTGH